MDQRNTALFLFLRVMRALCAYLVFLTVWLFCAFLFRPTHLAELPNVAVMAHAVRALMLPFIYFSVMRVFAEEDNAINAALDAKNVTGLLARIRCVLCSPACLIDIAAPLALAAILPVGAGYHQLAEVLFGGLSLAGVTRKLLVLCVVLPSLFILSLWARLSAWQKHTDGRGARGEVTMEREGADIPAMIAHTAGAHAYGGVRLGGTRGFAESDSAHRISAAERNALRGHKPTTLVWRLLALLGIYAVGGFALTYFVPIAISAWRILLLIGSVHWWLPVLLALGIVALVMLFFLLRAIRIRRRLLRRLRATCNEYGFSFTPPVRPYRSLLRLGDEVSFTVSANGKEYDCKLFAAIRRHYSLFFHESGTVYCTHSLRFRRVEFLCWTTTYRFDFKSEHEKLCIVAPVPNVIYAGDDKWHRPIDTGMSVGGYRIFSTTGFIGALQRDCIERDT